MYKVSFLIPAYNASAYIAKCLDHILTSTLPKEEYQIIVWNDGSTDDTLKIATEYSEAYNNITVVSKENMGVAEVRRNMFKLAQGEYIWECDSDDFIVTENIPRIVNYAYNKKLDILSFDYIQEDVFGNQKPMSVRFKHSIYVSFLWNKLYKNSFLRNNNVDFKGDLYTGDDVIFNCQAYANTTKTAHLNVLGYCYMYNPLSLTRDKNKSLEDVKSMIHCLDYFIEYWHTAKNKRIWTEHINKDIIMVKKMSEQYDDSIRTELCADIESKLEAFIKHPRLGMTKIIIKYPKVANIVNTYLDNISFILSRLYSKLYY